MCWKIFISTLYISDLETAFETKNCEKNLPLG
jgi:hypothetical protein